MPSPADYQWTIDLKPPADFYDDLGHMENVAVIRLLADTRTSWFGSLTATGAGGPILVRHLTVSYEREARPDDLLRCGVRALTQGITSITLDQLLWRSADEVPIAHATAVHVSWDITTRAAIPNRPVMIAAVEESQGSPLPVTRRQTDRS